MPAGCKYIKFSKIFNKLETKTLTFSCQLELLFNSDNIRGLCLWNTKIRCSSIFHGKIVQLNIIIKLNSTVV